MQLTIQQFHPPFTSDKPDVVLIHGTGAEGGLWSEQIDLLTRAGHRCLVPELRGHGQTPEPGEVTDIEVHINDLLETLDACEVKYPAVFVGHSLGAIISVVLAQKRPELFVKILAVSLPGKVLGLVSKAFSLIVSYPFEHLRGTMLHRSLSRRHQILFSTDRHSLQQIVHNFKRVNFVEQRLNLDCPVHFCVGRLDFVAPYFYVQRMHQALPGSTLRIFEWAGHCCMDDQAVQFNQWMLEKISESVVNQALAR